MASSTTSGSFIYNNRGLWCRGTLQATSFQAEKDIKTGLVLIQHGYILKLDLTFDLFTDACDGF